MLYQPLAVLPCFAQLVNVFAQHPGPLPVLEALEQQQRVWAAEWPFKGPSPRGLSCGPEVARPP